MFAAGNDFVLDKEMLVIRWNSAEVPDGFIPVGKAKTQCSSWTIEQPPEWKIK
jgi:hypothetical protein